MFFETDLFVGRRIAKYRRKRSYFNILKFFSQLFVWNVNKSVRGKSARLNKIKYYLNY